MPSPQLEKEAFERRFREQFSGSAFDGLEKELTRIAEAAWKGYADYEKSPRVRKAGPEFADPEQLLSLDWLEARQAIEEAVERHEDPDGPSRFLVVNASPRSEHTCPGEMSKSYRLAELATEIFAAAPEAESTVLDLSRLASEYGRRIHPCKGCFSTAPALCHWPCSCYPNHAMGQTQDWMNEIYPLWVEAHGVMIVTPVHWYQASSPLKLMMDRMVCADGGNPDPTLTRGKNAAKAKAIELEGWHYPRHLEGRFFAVVVHGDVAGAENVRRSIVDWLSFMKLRSAGGAAELDRYVGYWEPYATSHTSLDEDRAVQEEVRNAARSLLAAVGDARAGKSVRADRNLEAPREK